MTISYNWLSDYLPVQIEPEKLSKILTSVGLEVESMEQYENIKGALRGLVVGEVLSCRQHPNADKLKVTEVMAGEAQPLQIVCGASNVSAGQKVVVAKPGTTIYPIKGNPLTMEVANIRGIESHGMICSEDEIGMGDDHAGILVLPATANAGTPVADLFRSYHDWIFEIGLTPNRMDAMSHLGVARDVCAYLSHHDKKEWKAKSPLVNDFKADSHAFPFKVTIENANACRRYSGVTLSGVTITDSPQWLQDKLKSIGQRPINNIVDITNFILHETGQPLHAFDAEKVMGHHILVRNLPAGTSFVTLDEKERRLDKEDLMICDGNSRPMCIAGVFGGLQSGVSGSTRTIFLESAWFNPVDIRKTSFRHGLRTDAATRFEKNVDISNTANALKRAALMIREIAGGTISSDVVDVYPAPEEKIIVALSFSFLEKLSGKKYEPDTVKRILEALAFEIKLADKEMVQVAVPFSKPDISLPADIVEEVMRIDGYDNIEIPATITITPSVGSATTGNVYLEKAAAYLVGLGFNEIFTNSITNAAYFKEVELEDSVKLLNNLSAVHNVMRPSMLETGLEAIAYNLNRKSLHLQFFEFGKTYHSEGVGKYDEQDHLCFFISGDSFQQSWKKRGAKADFFYLKGVLEKIFEITGLPGLLLKDEAMEKMEHNFAVYSQRTLIGFMGSVHKSLLSRFDIRQPVWFADLQWLPLVQQIEKSAIRFRELPRQLPVNRDLALVVPRNLAYGTVETTIRKVRLDKLHDIALFDIFESEKLGKDKKSLAVSFTFMDEAKTLTDKEIDGMMQKIMEALEKDLSAEIRKQ